MRLGNIFPPCLCTLTVLEIQPGMQLCASIMQRVLQKSTALAGSQQSRDFSKAFSSRAATARPAIVAVQFLHICCAHKPLLATANVLYDPFCPNARNFVDLLMVLVGIQPSPCLPGYFLSSTLCLGYVGKRSRYSPYLP